MNGVECLWYGALLQVKPVKVVGSVNEDGDWVFNKPLVDPDKYKQFKLFRDGQSILPTSCTLHTDRLVCHM